MRECEFCVCVCVCVYVCVCVCERVCLCMQAHLVNASAIKDIESNVLHTITVLGQVGTHFCAKQPKRTKGQEGRGGEERQWVNKWTPHHAHVVL